MVCWKIPVKCLHAPCLLLPRQHRTSSHQNNSNQNLLIPAGFSLQEHCGYFWTARSLVAIIYIVLQQMFELFAFPAEMQRWRHCACSCGPCSCSPASHVSSSLRQEEYGYCPRCPTQSASSTSPSAGRPLGGLWWSSGRTWCQRRLVSACGRTRSGGWERGGLMSSDH